MSYVILSSWEETGCDVNESADSSKFSVDFISQLATNFKVYYRHQLDWSVNQRQWRSKSHPIISSPKGNVHNEILHPLKISPAGSLNPDSSTPLLLKSNNNRSLSLTYFWHWNRTCFTLSISSWQWSHLPVGCFPTNFNVIFSLVCSSLSLVTILSSLLSQREDLLAPTFSWIVYRCLPFLSLFHNFCHLLLLNPWILLY